MYPTPETAEDIEHDAAAVLTAVAVAAHGIADLALHDDHYDQVAALAASSYATEAAAYLPLPVRELQAGQGRICHLDLLRRLEEVADHLDELGRLSADPRQVRDRHTAAHHSRSAATALRNALPVEKGTEG